MHDGFREKLAAGNLPTVWLNPFLRNEPQVRAQLAALSENRVTLVRKNFLPLMEEFDAVDFFFPEK